MTVTLTPYAGEPELADPAMSGEWAAELAKMAAQSPPQPWGTYIAWRYGRAVGSGGFKAVPDADATVELAYLTFLPFQRTGVATGLAAALVAIARREGARHVIAHTLPEANPSTRVLAANGFAKTADVVDPDDGPVWRWELPLDGAAHG